MNRELEALIRLAETQGDLEISKDTIDNSETSEALNQYETVYDLALAYCEEHNPEIIKSVLETRNEIIKQALLKSQKDKVIADFVREHYKLSDDINENYLVLKKPITVEEDIKFKENL